MRQHLAKLTPAVLVAGCSFLYNPNNIDKPPGDARTDADAMPDAMIDANPASLEITGIESPALREGQGDDGGRSAVLVVRGKNIITGATLTITGSATVETVGAPVVSSQSDLIAIRVIARVDDTLGAGEMRDLMVTVTQPSPLGGNVSGMVTWKLEGLAELTGATGIIDTAAPREYSRVMVDSLGFTGAGAILVRTTAGITVTNNINISASASTPGPGGGAGGGSSTAGTGPGGGKQGNSTTLGGGGAGFSEMGNPGAGGTAGGAPTGDVNITSYATNVSSGGGGATSFGGGGGGTIELTAGGDLSIASIAAKGAVGSGNLTTGGGGGSGGVIVLRAGAGATIGGSLDVAGSLGGFGTTASGGAGKAGRVRVDAASVTGSLSGGRRGVMFASTADVIVRSAMPNVPIVGTANARYDVQRTTTTFAPLGTKTTVDFGGATTVDATPTLVPGWNRVCLVPENGGLGNPESRNCIDLAYLP